MSNIITFDDITIRGDLELLPAILDVPEITWISGGYINANGAIVSRAGWEYTDLIPLEEGSTVYVRANFNNNVAGIAFYDASGSFVRYDNATYDGGESVFKAYAIDYPVASMRATASVSSSSSVYPTILITKHGNERSNYSASDMERVFSLLGAESVKSENTNANMPIKIENGYWYLGRGEFSVDTERKTAYYRVASGQEISITSSESSASAGIYPIYRLWKPDGSFVDGTSNLASGPASATVTIPSGVELLSVSGRFFTVSGVDSGFADDLTRKGSGFTCEHIEPVSYQDGWYNPGKATFLPGQEGQYRCFEYDVSEFDTVTVQTNLGGGSYYGTVSAIRFANDDMTKFSEHVSAAGANVINDSFAVPGWATKLYVVAQLGNDFSSWSLRFPNAQVNGNSKFALWFGDSYTQAASLRSNGLDRSKRFSTLVSKHFGLAEMNYGCGGAGFVAYDSVQMPYPTQLETAIADTTYPHDLVDKVFICGGRNDSISNIAQIKSAISGMVSDIKDEFPNADIVFVPMMYDANSLAQSPVAVYQAIMDECSDLECSVIPNAYMWLLGKYDYILPDNVHPNETGHALIATHIIEALETGMSFPYPVSVKLPTVSPYVDASDTSSYVALSQENGLLFVDMDVTLTQDVPSGANVAILEDSTTRNVPVFISANNDGKNVPVCVGDKSYQFRVLSTVSESGYTIRLYPSAQIAQIPAGRYLFSGCIGRYGKRTWAHNF